MIITTILVNSIPLVYELVTDYNEIVMHKQVDKHFKDFVWRGIMIVGVNGVLGFSFSPLHFDWLQAIQGIAIGITWFWLLFDYILNPLINRPVLSLGTTSWLDRQLRTWPWWAVLYCKIFAFIAAIMFTVKFDAIRGYLQY